MPEFHWEQPPERESCSDHCICSLWTAVTALATSSDHWGREGTVVGSYTGVGPGMPWEAVLESCCLNSCSWLGEEPAALQGV